jgi:hypothetical protein
MFDDPVIPVRGLDSPTRRAGLTSRPIRQKTLLAVIETEGRRLVSRKGIGIGPGPATIRRSLRSLPGGSKVWTPRASGPCGHHASSSLSLAFFACLARFFRSFAALVEFLSRRAVSPFSGSRCSRSSRAARAAFSSCLSTHVRHALHRRQLAPSLQVHPSLNPVYTHAANNLLFLVRRMSSFAFAVPRLGMSEEIA